MKRCICSLFAVLLLSVSCLALDDTPPSDPPFVGSLYVTGTVSGLGTVTLYLPVNYRSGYLGLSSDGYLYNVSSSSLSGVMYRGSTAYTVSFSGFSLPRYRLRDSSGYSYDDLYFVPTASNAQIADTMPPVYDVADVQMYIVILFLGVVILCFMKRS